MQTATEWMTSKHAARVWGVSERTARRYFAQLNAPLHLIADDTGVKRLRRVVPVGTPCPEVPPAGNPNFYDEGYQRGLSERRWDGHITKADAQALAAALDDEALQNLRDQIEADYELGMPEPPRDLQEGEELPPFEPDPEPEMELPPHLKYPDKVTRDYMERKEARKRRPTEP